MNEGQVRRKMRDEGYTDEEIEQQLDEMADRRRDEQRDREAEQHFKEKA